MHLRISSPGLYTEVPEDRPYVYNGNVYPARVFEKSPQFKASIGLYEVKNAPVPDGHNVISWSIEIQGDYAIRTPQTAPKPPVIPELDAFQFWTLVDQLGLRDTTEAKLQALRGPDSTIKNKIIANALENQRSYRREVVWAWMSALAPDSGITKEQFDAAWAAVSTLVVPMPEAPNNVFQSQVFEPGTAE